MFHEEIQSTIHIVEDMLAKAGTTSFFKCVHEHPDLHLFYKHFFLSVEHQWADALVLPLRENTLFTFALTPITFVRETIHATLFEHAVLAPSTFSQLLRTAVEARYNFLIRPRITLQWFVFGEKPLRSLEYIRNRVQGLTGYEYLTNGIIAHLSEGDSVAPEQIISVIDFTRAVSKVDQEYLLHIHDEEFVALFNPMFELFGEIYRDNNDEPFEGIPTPAVIIFLEEKRIPGFAEYFELLLNDKDNPKKFITKQDIYHAIATVVPPTEQEDVLLTPEDNSTESVLHNISDEHPENVLSENVLSENVLSENVLSENVLSLYKHISPDVQNTENTISEQVQDTLPALQHNAILTALDSDESLSSGNISATSFLEGKSNIIGIAPISDEEE